jgi:hypothetical protein
MACAEGLHLLTLLTAEVGNSNPLYPELKYKFNQYISENVGLAVTLYLYSGCFRLECEPGHWVSSLRFSRGFPVFLQADVETVLKITLRLIPST